MVNLRKVDSPPFKRHRVNIERDPLSESLVVRGDRCHVARKWWSSTCPTPCSYWSEPAISPSHCSSAGRITQSLCTAMISSSVTMLLPFLLLRTWRVTVLT